MKPSSSCIRIIRGIPSMIGNAEWLSSTVTANSLLVTSGYTNYTAGVIMIVWIIADTNTTAICFSRFLPVRSENGVFDNLLQ